MEDSALNDSDNRKEIKWFHFNSRGCCLLCLKLISSSSTELERYLSISTLVAYLKINLWDVLPTKRTDGNVRSLEKVEMMADMCKECAEIARKTSERFLALEKVRMELNYNLDLIHKRISTMVRSPNVNKNSDKISEATERLRMRLSYECSELISSQFQPKVVLERINPESTLRQLLEGRFRNEEESMESGCNSDDDGDGDPVQMDRMSTPSPTIMSTSIKVEMQEKPTLEDENDSNPLKKKNNLLCTSVPCATKKSCDRKCTHKCKYCSRLFNSNAELDRHCKSVHQGTRFRCNFANCSKTFIYKILLNRHLKKKHHQTKVELNEVPQLRPSTVPGAKEEEKKRYKCSFCPKRFYTNSGLSSHRSTEHYRPKPKCAQCNKTFYSDGTLRTHQERVHKGNKKVIFCDFSGCSRTFSANVYLENHRQSVHLNLSGFPCDYCQKTFRSALKLDRHRRKVHFQQGKTKDARFTCEICGKVYRLKTALDLHRDSKHLGIRYRCTVSGCSSSYVQPWQLVSHQKAMHPGVSFETLPVSNVKESSSVNVKLEPQQQDVNEK